MGIRNLRLLLVKSSFSPSCTVLEEQSEGLPSMVVRQSGRELHRQLY